MANFRWGKWHRWTGISIFVFLLLFAASGLAIQHAHGLGLDKRYITAAMTAGFYGVTIDAPVEFKTEHHWVSHAGHFLYIDGVPVAWPELTNLQGVVEDASFLWIAGDDQLWLLSDGGELADSFSVGGGLPDIMTAIGYGAGNEVVMRGLNGNWFIEGRALDPDWQTYAGQPAWSVPEQRAAAGESGRLQVLAHARGHLITWERFLLDLHSGRLFGPVGVIIADIASVMFFLLVGSGLILQIKRWRED